MKFKALLIPLTALGSAVPSAAAELVRKFPDLCYATVEGQNLLLDLYLPTASGGRETPLVVYVHGGAWRGGSRNNMPLTGLLHEGFAIASVEYRLSPVARFPAQIHDIKAAIRFLRAKHAAYGYSAERIAIAGSSAGGHLAALVGVTNGHPELEGTVGAHLDQPSNIEAIVAFYGAANLLSILPQSTPHGLSVRVPALQLLLGARPEENQEIAKLASPLFHVDESDPALLLLHGDQDLQMPINQSLEFYGRYRELGLTVALEVVHGGAHGGAPFYDGERIRLVADFLRANLR